MTFFEKLENMYENFSSLQEKEAFCALCDANLKYFTQFDSQLLYNPAAFFDALLENDLLWKKIDTDEIEKILSDLQVLDDYKQGIIDEKTYLEKTYNIKIIFHKDDVCALWANIYWAWLGVISQWHMLKKLKKLLDFYPVNFIKNIKLQEIVCVAYFYRKDEFGNTIQLGGFETVSDNNIYLSMRNLVDAFDHELYHQAMQYYDDRNEWEKLREWVNLLYMYDQIEKEVKGFARNYGKENISEDQATVAEALVLNYQYTMQRAQKDEILMRKIQLVKKAYFELSQGSMDENFWMKKYGN